MKEIIDRNKTREAIRNHQEGINWEYKDEATRLYALAQEMDRRFFNGLVYPDGTKVPTPVIAFEDLRNKNTLAHYSLFPDEFGIIGKITFNTAWYTEVDGKKEWDLGRYSQGETLCHEYMHLYQQIGRGKDPYNQKKHGRVFHNREFVELCERLGIHPELVTGVHTRIATIDSPIDVLLREMGIKRPDGADQVPQEHKKNWASWIIGKDKKKGKSTLNKWICPGCHLAVRIGIKSDPLLIHEPCGVHLVRADSGTIYES